ncbi:DUF2231 domain-containing protein [Hyphomonas sp.]|uniref:DUF2231 domain-containing protein n=1 Tax=Hyphomonas sp. TaxID=87 RepID=UPI0030F88328
MQLLEPNIHPVLVHFAYALSMSATAAYLAQSFWPAGHRKDSLMPAADWMLAFAAVSILLTIAAGFQAYYTVAHDGASHAVMTTHRNWAVPSGTAVLALAVWRWISRANAPSLAFKGLLATAALGLSVTAWWGGTIVYGYGLGVKQLPVAEGTGHEHHDHDAAHGDNDIVMLEGMDTTSMDMSGLGMDEDDHHAMSHDHPVTSAEAGSPESIVDAFSLALTAGDADAATALLLPDAIIAEGGSAERSLADYAGHHLPADMAFTSAVETSLKQRDVIANDTESVVISESQMHGMFDGKAIHSRMMETVVLKHTTDGWKIAHIHWSSTPITDEHKH